MPSENDRSGNQGANRCPDCGAEMDAPGGVCPVCSLGASEDDILDEVGGIIHDILETGGMPEASGPADGEEAPAPEEGAFAPDVNDPSGEAGDGAAQADDEADPAQAEVPGLDGIEDLIEKISNPDTLFKRPTPVSRMGPPPPPAKTASIGDTGSPNPGAVGQAKPRRPARKPLRKPGSKAPGGSDEEEIVKVRRITMVERRRKGTKLIRRGKVQCGNCHQIFDLAKLPAGAEKCLNCGSKMLQKFLDPGDAALEDISFEPEAPEEEVEETEGFDEEEESEAEEVAGSDVADAGADEGADADADAGSDVPEAPGPAIKRQGMKDYYEAFHDAGNIYADLDVDTRGSPECESPEGQEPSKPGGWGEALKGELVIKKKAEEEAVLRDDYLLNKKIGQYLVMSIIGRGGMGTVYKAREESGRLVALKVLPPMYSRDQSKVDRFMREAEAARKLDHPNVVKCFDYGSEGDVNYIAMELVEGKSVGDLIKEKRAVKIEESLRIIKYVAEALQSAHDRGIIHRDIKPDNIMIHANGLIQVADFGLARNIEAGGSLSGSGEIVGTPYYISPEQIDCLDVDARADIYSLGATIYHLVTGKRPFEGETPMEVLLKHVNEKLVPPVDLNPLIPLPVGRVMQKMLEKHREFRYQNCSELISDIAMIEKGVMPSIILEEETEPKKVPVPPVVTRGRPVALISFLWMAAVAVAALAVRHYVLPPMDESPMFEPVINTDNSAQIALKEAIEFLEDNPDEIAQAIARLKKVADSMRGSEEADRALRKAEDLEGKLNAEMEKWASSRLDAARAYESQDRPGKALLELASDPPRKLTGVLRPAILASEEARLCSVLEKRGQALVRAGRVTDRTGGGSGPTLGVEAFLIDLAEVSCAEYAQFVESTGALSPWGGSGPPAGCENLPVTGVDFESASNYAKWRSKRLPTEHEWELAAAGPDGRPYPFGRFFDQDKALSRLSGAAGPLDVRSMPEGRTPEGVFNLAGNVHEWTSTIARDGLVVVRGGSFDSHPCNLRTDARLLLPASTRDHTLGFRLASDP